MARRPGKRSASPIAYILVAAVVFIIIAVPFLLKEKRESVVYTRPLMGTIVELTLMDGMRSGFDQAAEAGFSEIKRLERLLSSYDPASDVSRISASAGKGPVLVSSEVVEVMEKALEIAELSNGAFDPTVGSLASVWGYSGESGTVPSEEEVKKLLALVDYHRISVNPEASTVTLEKSGLVLNLGGVAKGYIVGKAIEKLTEKGVNRGIVKAGGDLTVFQVTWPGKPFIIGIKHPRKPEKLIGEAHVLRGAVTTSGDYERFFMKDGVRYHHILDPKTGYPARGTRSVTIIAESSTYADALSTAVFVMGPEAGMELVEKLPGVEAVIVDSEGNISRSHGFRGFLYKN